jgi:flagellar hook-associated protein 1 FlgK
MLGGTDVTGQLQGGQIGANIALRDTTLPTFQAELDEFAQNLASRFDAQGLDLFTDPSGNVPLGGGVPVQNGYVGFAGTIQVNQAVQANPSLVRDGTPNSNPNDLAGYTGIIDAVLNNVLGSNPALDSNAIGLGPAGNLSAPYASATLPYATPSTLQQLAGTMLASQAQESATISTQADTEQVVQTSLASKLSAQSGVNMDAEMSHMIQLQNAYAANARIITAVQAMWTQLLQSVP